MPLWRPRGAVRSSDGRIVARAARRIGLQTMAAVAVAVIASASIALLVDLHSQHQADDGLLALAIARGDVSDPTAGVWLVVRRGGHEQITQGLPQGLPDQGQLDAVAAHRTASSTVVDTRHGRQYRLTTRSLPNGGVAQAVLDLRPELNQRWLLLEAFLIAGLVGLALSACAGVWLARLAVRPLATALVSQHRFVADASHELRTPLTLLSTRAQLIRRTLRTSTDAEPVRADVERLVTDSDHLTAILDDLLLAVDPRENHVIERVSVPSVVAQVVESARPLADENEVTLSSVTVGEPGPVRGAETALRRAVTALVDNAIRHAHGAVRITTTAAGDDVRVEVRDDGPGIAPELVSTLFDRFATSPSDGRADSQRRYGIGLALVGEIADRHGGSVSVIDNGYPGATFRLCLPARRGE
jgi:signal transduction histidine kinase